jgi:hypothetical protein
MIDTPRNTIRILQYHTRKTLEVMAELLQDAASWKYDIIAIQEPWRNKINAPYYTRHNPIKDRYYVAYPNYEEARVCFFVSNRIPKENITLIDGGERLLTLPIASKIGDGKSLTIHNIYNTPPLGAENQPGGLTRNSAIPGLAEALEQNASDNTIVLGDLNLHHERWSGPPRPGKSYLRAPPSACFNALMNQHALELLTPAGLVTRPLKEHADEGNTLDLAGAGEPIASKPIRIQVDWALHKGSDHKAIGIEIGLQLARENEQKRRLIRQMNVEILRNSIQRDLPQTMLIRSIKKLDDTCRELSRITRYASELAEEHFPFA